MSVLDIIRLVLGTALLITGLIVFIIEIIGIFRQKYVLNRLHAAAMGDTMGFFCSILGLMILEGFSFVTVKLALIIVLFWLTSPVASHMTALLESYTNDKLDKHLVYHGDLETLEKQLKNDVEEEK